MTRGQEALLAPVRSDDVGNMTVKDYLVTLLVTLWDEKDGFSGKRPFGNSAWQFDLYGALVRAGLVSGSFDEFGYVEEVDDETCDKIILEAIEAL